MERLDKFLAEAGAGTRSQVKPILKVGRVKVNGTVVKDGSLPTATQVSWKQNLLPVYTLDESTTPVKNLTAIS